MSSRHLLYLLALTSVLTSTAVPAFADEWRHERAVQRWDLTHPNVAPVQNVVPVYPTATPYSQINNRYRREERRTERIQFAEWIQSHPQWMQMHSARARLFLSNPSLAEHYRHEWFR